MNENNNDQHLGLGRTTVKSIVNKDVKLTLKNAKERNMAIKG